MKTITKSLVNKKRSIIVTENNLIYYTPKDGITEFFSYNEELLQILMHDNIRTSRSGKRERLRLAVCKNGQDHKFYAHTLAYAAYHGYLTEDTYIPKLEEFRDYKLKNNFDIDHADDAVHNSTKNNLSLMDRSLNHRKGHIAALFKDDSTLVSVHHNGKYRVAMEYMLPLESTTKLFESESDKIPIHDIVRVDACFPVYVSCADATEYVECLEWLSRFRVDSNYLCRDEQGKLPKSFEYHTFKDTGYSISNQGVLCDIPDDRFLTFSAIKEQFTEQRGNT